jgi:hypothetical protein
MEFSFSLVLYKNGGVLIVSQGISLSHYSPKSVLRSTLPDHLVQWLSTCGTRTLGERDRPVEDTRKQYW